VLLRVNERTIDSALTSILATLRSGGVIIYPTDTVYALGCDFTQQKAVERVARLKGLNPEKAQFSFVCSDLSHLSRFTRPIPNNIFRIMKRVLPGPYTFILEANNNVPRMLKQNTKKTVGIRVPDNAICRAIVEALGNPLISTSVIDEHDEIVEYLADPETISERFGDKVDIVIDGGYGNLYPSTLVDCSGGEVEVIREGLGSLEPLFA
jgi:tRNA threonylcarbamoyl adenosine modification protein (Sua5/YciO/YrdC/YwlC family)